MTLRFQALGSFAVYHEGRPIPRSVWGSHRALTLTKVLLTHRNQAIHKEQLCEWIWPNASADAAERNLYIATSDMRRALEPNRPPRSPSRYVCSDGDTLELNTADCWVDADVLLHAADVDPHAPHALPALDEAARLYAGAYLPDDLYADWAQVERDRLALAHETIIFKLADAHAARSDYQAAVTACRRGLIRYPMSEAGVARFMRYASCVGEVALALRAYESLVTALRREMQIEPEPHLARMADCLRQGLPIDEVSLDGRLTWQRVMGADDTHTTGNGHHGNGTAKGYHSAHDASTNGACANGHSAESAPDWADLRAELARVDALVMELSTLSQRLRSLLGDLA